LGTFAETKVPRLPGRIPATQKRMMRRELAKQGATHSPTNASQEESFNIDFR
jgi:hypothetical protein